MKAIKIILITLGVVFLILFAIGFIMGFTESQSIPNTTGKFTKEQTVLLDKTFMDECMAVDLNSVNFDQKAYCQCALDGIKTDIGYEKFVKDNTGKNLEDMSSVMQPYVNRCLVEQGIEV